MFLAAAEMRGLMNGRRRACEEMGARVRARALARLAGLVSFIDGGV